MHLLNHSPELIAAQIQARGRKWEQELAGDISQIKQDMRQYLSHADGRWWIMHSHQQLAQNLERLFENLEAP